MGSMGNRSISAEERRILVTGGLGFIGVHLCQALLSRYPGCELSIVDNLSSTKTDYAALRPHANISIMDLRDFQPLHSEFTDIFHLASPVGSLGILSRHGHIASDILELAHKVSSLAAASNADLLYLSSSEVYGRDGQHGENTELIVPSRYGTRMEYALGKLTAEHVLQNLSNFESHRLRIVRPFNVVGPYQSAELGFVLPIFFNAALRDQPLPVHGDGRQLRSLCHVDDLVAGLIAVQERGRAGALYNVGNPNNRISIGALAERIIGVCNSRSVMEPVDPVQRYGKFYLEAFNKQPVIDRVSKETGWAPSIGLTKLLDRMHEWFTAPEGTSKAANEIHSDAELV